MTSAANPVTDVTLSLARPEDRAVVIGLLAAQLAEHDIPTTEEGLERAVRGMLEDARRGTIFLAWMGERAVGLACLSYTWTLELGGHSAWLDELYVAPELRSKGIGRALLTRAIAHAREGGAAAVDLEVVEGHERAALLYEREGFERRYRTRWALAL